MDIPTIKTKITVIKDQLRLNSGKLVSSSENGPIGIGLIEDLVAIAENLRSGIEDLKRRVTELEK